MKECEVIFRGSEMRSTGGDVEREAGGQDPRDIEEEVGEKMAEMGGREEKMEGEGKQNGRTRPQKTRRNRFRFQLSRA
eukprot:4641932-Pleurochrysis_carterae.AAC.2